MKDNEIKRNSSNLCIYRQSVTKQTNKQQTNKNQKNQKEEKQSIMYNYYNIRNITILKIILKTTLKKTNNTIST